MNAPSVNEGSEPALNAPSVNEPPLNAPCSVTALALVAAVKINVSASSPVPISPTKPSVANALLVALPNVAAVKLSASLLGNEPAVNVSAAFDGRAPALNLVTSTTVGVLGVNAPSVKLGT